MEIAFFHGVDFEISARADEVTNFGQILCYQ